MKSEIQNILKLIKNIDKQKGLPGNCYYLNDDLIYCQDRPDGDSRHPYSVDGLTLWAHASGYISINESNFFLIPPSLEGKQPFMAFFGGLKEKDSYKFTSITGVNDICDTPTYCIFSDTFVYYIKKLNDVIYASKLTISENKEVLISNIAINTGKDIKDIYLSSFINPIMAHAACESEESKWFKRGDLTSYGAKFLGIEDLSREIHLTNYAVIKRCSNKDVEFHSSTSRGEFCGGVNKALFQSPVLKNGEYEKEKQVTQFSETAAYSDIAKAYLKPNENLQVDYQITIAFNEEDLVKLENVPFSFTENDKQFEKLSSKPLYEKDFSIKFGKLNDYDLDNEAFNRFLNSVKGQVNYSANAKNSSLRLLGIRDVYQMLEASLMWNPSIAREKILASFNYIDISGRAPRQISITSSNENPLMDNREFIDQGQWIISTLFTYLSYTNDYSILNEEVKYIELIGRNSARKLEITDTVYDHLVKITNFLISNIDPETGCLCTLYGDWNDAVDGLGTTIDPNKNFGNGVSSMATFHLYKNLHEMADIVKVHNNDESLINNYLNIAKNIETSANQQLIVKKGNESKIIHGWGENKSFYVGSFMDVDGKSRDSATSNAFYVISGLYKNNPNMRETILNAYHNLDSKYGLKTFSEFFDRDAYKVGRIINLPKGTAENAATYIHGAMFAVKSLFMMNEGKLAFDQIYKLIPITHKKISTTPFVMPNSYVYNPKIGVDGESMSDWYTGSSNTLIKTLVSDLFGVTFDLENNLILTPSNYFPSDKANLILTAKGKKLNINYINNHIGNRIIQINGETIATNIIDISKYNDSITIEIVD